jgi:sugar phosphate isomerase/epimerase
MQRLLSTYLFVSRKLTRELIGQIAEAGFQGVEIFCSRAHFDYTNRAEIRAMAQALADHRLSLASLHAPTSRDLSAMREGGQPTRFARWNAYAESKRWMSCGARSTWPTICHSLG